MKIYSIDNLKKELTADGFFDLSTPTFVMFSGSKFLSYTIKDNEEMRPDLVSNSIYGNTNNTDFLLSLNGIINPMNMRKGDLIIYVEEQAIANFRPIPEVIDNIKSQFINLNKKKSKDKNREKRKDEKTPLPPTVNQRKINPIKIKGKTITIGDGLFNV